MNNRYLVVYNWRIFDNKKSLFICVPKGHNWLVKEDITPDGENYYGGQEERFVGMEIHADSPAVKEISIYDTIDPDPTTDDYLKRLGVQ